MNFHVFIYFCDSDQARYRIFLGPGGICAEFGQKPPRLLCIQGPKEEEILVFKKVIIPYWTIEREYGR